MRKNLKKIAEVLLVAGFIVSLFATGNENSNFVTVIGIIGVVLTATTYDKIQSK